MNGLDVVAVGALILLGVILVVLLMQALKVREIWQMMLMSKEEIQGEGSCAIENKELRSALRAEKAHVEQLQGKVVLLMALVPAA
ncbi:hypothetical protein M2401_004878 [Pseudomonas sp. JUb42]|uniref:hypothetical protein n=1 Tax=Pseudomonas sp. JUb42 TaxID=2940611 RepID=UPI00216AAD7E|nr:hypothetical protein [Pseudomonas sp. JUb42]MCS3471117.1 hypothetical protein [Pseudomonas sp. JUb42]